MLANFVGPVDINSALVLAAAIICACVVVTSLIVKRRSRQDVNNEYELAKMKQKSEDTRLMYQFETDRVYKLKQIEQGLITSHARSEG